MIFYLHHPGTIRWFLKVFYARFHKPLAKMSSPADAGDEILLSHALFNKSLAKISSPADTGDEIMLAYAWFSKTN